MRILYNRTRSTYYAVGVCGRAEVNDAPAAAKITAEVVLMLNLRGRGLLMEAEMSGSDQLVSGDGDEETSEEWRRADRTCCST